MLIPLASRRSLHSTTAAIETNGFAVARVEVPEAELIRLTRDLEALSPTVDLGTRGGVRDAFRLIPRVRELAVGAPMWQLASGVLGQACAAVRAIIFDKTPDANWKVSWHQDLTIAVKRRIEVEGYGP